MNVYCHLRRDTEPTPNLFIHSSLISQDVIISLKNVIYKCIFCINSLTFIEMEIRYASYHLTKLQWVNANSYRQMLTNVTQHALVNIVMRSRKIVFNNQYEKLRFSPLLHVESTLRLAVIMPNSVKVGRPGYFNENRLQSSIFDSNRAKLGQSVTGSWPAGARPTDGISIEFRNSINIWSALV